MPNTVEEIGNQAFMGCLSLENILLSSSLKTIGTQAFENCESLENIAIPSLVENIGTFAFRNCKSVKTLSFEGSESSPTLEMPQIGFYYDDPSFYDIGAFTNCDPMTIRIDRNISYTPNGNIASKFAFKYAPTILNIGEHCSSVDKYLWKNGNISNLLIEDRTINLVLPNAFSVDYLYLGGNVNMPISAANVNIGPKVTELPNEMFNGSSFESIILPSGITQIGEYAFSNCVNITSIIIPDEIVKIPTGCFNGCSALTRVVLPESISEINNLAFQAVNLEMLECKPTIPPVVDEDAFSNKTFLDACLIVPKESVGAYQTALIWNNFFNINHFSPISEIKVSEEDLTLEEGGSQSLQVEYSTNDGGYPDIGEGVIWKSSNEDVAIVDDNGLITAAGIGTCKVGAYLKSNESIYSESNITIVPKIPLEFEVDGIRYRKIDSNNAMVIHYEYEGSIRIPEVVTINSIQLQVIEISENAFKNCANLECIIIPSSVNNLANDVLSGCSSLKQVEFRYSSTPITLGYNSKINLSSNVIPYPNPSTVDERRTGFRNGYYDGLFYGLPIEKLVINRDIELSQYYERTVGSSASSYSTVYNDIIYYPPFYGLSNLKYVEIGENVSAICKNKIEAVVNAKPTTMDYTNFGQCDNVEVVVSNNPKAPVGGGFSQKAYDNANLFLPNGGESSYESDESWKNFLHKTPGAFVPVENISFITDEFEIGFNESYQLKPIINPEDASIQRLHWTSSSPTIVQISGDGIVSTSEKEGESIITATSTDGSNKSVSCKIVVRKSNAGIEGISSSEEQGTFVVYNLQGIMVLRTKLMQELQNLPAGIYIVNGKKTMIN